MVKILVVGDFHGKFPSKLKKEAKKADFVLSTGDFGGSDRLLKVIFKYFSEGWHNIVGPKKTKEYIMEDYNSGKNILKELNSLGKPVYTISGNWDFVRKSSLERTGGINVKMFPKIVKKMKNVFWWNRGIKKVQGIKILAFGGKVTAYEYLNKNGYFRDKPKKVKKFIKENKKEIDQIMKHGRKELDILFAHYPPYGYFDVVKYKGENPMNGKHVGFEGFTKYIKKYQPKVFICGHMHEYRGMKKLGKTLIIATGAAKEGRAVKLEIEKNKKIKVDFIN